MRSESRWVTATKGRDQRSLTLNGTSSPSYNHPPPQFWLPPGGLDGTIHAAYAAMGAQKLVSPDGSASRSMLTPTRVGDVGRETSAVVFSEHRLHSASRSVATSLHFPGL